ncbi:serine/threonine protein phosphatase [Streptomyces cellostaticus]|uniref:non-specific serine/threonine protein kinase n=1 Tax=Streptomyces cellostaticus TaxID=67285 RepID=A0A117PU60_9ACTN|nr:serine/threonine-protein kinase [Streptomyces cellostaticus]KUM91610.1 serine/threonine protein phosphatase [Streptomyces cellostaticus]GHI03604.1 serine/threonine protein kinase [Streptomyces cellostaticus]
MADERRLVAGRYRLNERIGRGGMGTVWRAQDEVLAREVALKQLHTQPHLTDDELATLYERTRREARSAARVVHPNVVVVHDVVDDEGRPCIVMEYVRAPTLADLLKGGRAVPPEEAARIGLGMIAALRAAHAADVLHRDVKPGNVLLGAEGRIVLTDFGIAVTAGASTLTQTGQMVGSIDYMAPERIRGHKPGPASDLWSLGATLYQAVEGRPPYRRETAMETAYAIAVDPLEPMRQAGALEPLIDALLTKDPEQRPSAEQTERALRAASADGTGTAGHALASAAAPASPVTQTGPVPAPPPTQTGPAPDSPTRAHARRKRRTSRRRLALVSAVVALAAAAGAVTYVTARHHGEGLSLTQHTTHTPTPSATPTPAAVPDGYHLVSDTKLGVSFPLPDGWKAGKRTGDTLTYTDPTGLVGITIGTVEPAGPNPVTHFQDIEANTKVNYPSYRRLRMQQTTFRGQPAAVWEFTFRGRARDFRAIDLGYGREGGREYDIYLSAPEAQWDTHRPVFDVVRDGFATSG